MKTETIDFTTWQQIDIAIGTITTVEVVPDADKLLRLEVDVGEEDPRQIVSAIRNYYDDPQVLVGVQCPFILNLPPRTIRGYESQGMILAATTEKEALALLNPNTQVTPGTRIY